MADNDLKAIRVSENTTFNTSKWLGISDNIIVVHEYECSLYRNQLQAHCLGIPNKELCESSTGHTRKPIGGGFRLVPSNAPQMMGIQVGGTTKVAKPHSLFFLAFNRHQLRTYCVLSQR